MCLNLDLTARSQSMIHIIYSFLPHFLVTSPALWIKPFILTANQDRNVSLQDKSDHLEKLCIELATNGFKQNQKMSPTTEPPYHISVRGCIWISEFLAFPSCLAGIQNKNNLLLSAYLQVIVFQHNFQLKQLLRLLYHQCFEGIRNFLFFSV